MYKLIFADEDCVAGYARIKKEPILNTILCKGGSNWVEAVFSSKSKALSAIRRTNSYRKKKGWESFEFYTVEV